LTRRALQRVFRCSTKESYKRSTVHGGKAGSARQAQPAKQQRTSEKLCGSGLPVATPQRFIGYLFDDIHVEAPT